jgi:hypothetical protein
MRQRWASVGASTGRAARAFEIERGRAVEEREIRELSRRSLQKAKDQPVNASVSVSRYADDTIRAVKTRWDKAFFAEGVVLMTLDQMVTTEAKKDLARHALSEAEASVSIAKLRHKR